MMIDWKTAQEIILSQNVGRKTESVSLEESLNRVLAEKIYADRDYPPLHRSAVDGFALNSKNFSNQKKYKVIKKIFAGETLEQREWKENECIKIMTGGAVPEGLDCVLPIEEAQSLENDFVCFPKLETVKPWQNIAIKGEDVKSSKLLMSTSKNGFFRFKNEDKKLFGYFIEHL